MTQTAIFVLLVILIVAGYCLWLRLSSTRCSESREVVEKVDNVPFLRDMIRLGKLDRLTMRPRYVSRPYDTGRSDMLAAQILADQQTAHEEPGEVVHVPAPGEDRYREPNRPILVRSGQFKIKLFRDGTVMWSEITTHGAETPYHTIPHEWAELVAVLAMDVATR